jgi:hypothetical protein
VGGRDVDCASDELFRRNEAREDVETVDAILERQHAGVRTDQGRKGRRGRLAVVQFDREQHEVHRADLHRIGRRWYARQVQVTKRALQAQTIATQGLEVGTAGHEGHVLASGGQPPAQVPADPAGAHHCDPHGRSPLSLENTRSRLGRELSRGAGSRELGGKGAPLSRSVIPLVPVVPEPRPRP